MVDLSKIKTRAAAISIISNSLLIILKVAVGIATNSISIISEAAHSAVDLLAALIAYFSIKEAHRPADAEHPYGHGKFENVSGLVEGMLIAFAAIFIIHEAISKIISADLISSTIPGILVMLFSVICNYFVSLYLFRVAQITDSLALEADAWHLRTDVFTSLGIFLGLIILNLTGYRILDPIIAIITALWLLKISISLSIKSAKDMIDTRLSEEEEKLIIDILNRNSKDFSSFHKMRTRKGGLIRFVDLHLVVPASLSAEKTHQISHRLEREIREILPQTQLIIHFEPCRPKENDCKNCNGRDHCDRRR